LKARIATELLVLTALGFGLSPPVSSVSSPLVVTLNNARYQSLGPYDGIAVNITNTSPMTLHLAVFAVWEDSAGRTFAVTTAGMGLMTGASGVGFAPLLNPLASGRYLVFVFVVTTENNPVSATLTVSLNID
jgi:hypothetical protein